MDPIPTIESVSLLSSPSIQVNTLRLDLIHPIISGNKWYKLKFYLSEAKAVNAKVIASFGGPFSNHLVALAYAAKMNGLKSIGFVRSNENESVTPSLQEALNYGMKLIHLGRTQFQSKKNELLALNVENLNETYFLDEGGYGNLGAKGASTIISDWENRKTNADDQNQIHDYDYIICAVGTGTMIAGIINAAKNNQKVIGIPVLKNEGTINDEIDNLIQNKFTNFTLFHEFHQGGYAKTTPKQIEFMNKLWEHNKIPTDIVYTGKVFYAVEQLLDQSYFKPDSKILIIHSGGLQGNRSLEKGVLIF